MDNPDVIALAGYSSRAGVQAVAPKLADHGIALVGAATGAVHNDPPANLFNTRASYRREIERIVDHSVRVCSLTRVAVVYPVDDKRNTYPPLVAAALSKHAKSLAAAVPMERSGSDADQVAKKLREASFDTVIVASTHEALVALVGATRRPGAPPQIASISYDATSAARVLGSAGRGVVFAQAVPIPWKQASPLVREYTKDLVSEGSSAPGFQSLEGYVMCKVLVAAIRAAGPQLSRASLLSIVRKLPAVDFGPFDVDFAGRGQNGSVFADITVLDVDGRSRD